MCSERSRMGLRVCGIAIAVFMLLGCGLSEARAAIRAGVAVVNITADKSEQPIRDPLFAKVLLLDDGNNKAVIITMDLVLATGPLVKDIRSGVQQKLGIAPSAVMINASHNHDTFDAIAPDLVAKIVAGVKQAGQTTWPGADRRGRRPRRPDHDQPPAPHEGRNALDHPPRHAVAEGRRGGRIRAAGPADRTLRVDTAEGKPLALVYNFAGHAYCGMPGGGVSADFPGYASRVIEEAWPGAVALFVQGAAGDVTPVRYKDFDGPPPTEQLGTRLGLSALEAAQKHFHRQPGRRSRPQRNHRASPPHRHTPSGSRPLLAEQDKILEFFTGIGCGSHGAGVSLNFKTFLPLYMKYTSDPSIPSEDAYHVSAGGAVGPERPATIGQRQQETARHVSPVHREHGPADHRPHQYPTPATELGQAPDGADIGRGPGH